MSVGLAHDLKEKDRTEDIKISENVAFSAMLLSENVQKGLQKCGYQKPSPIQLKAIPLGRCGFDLIIKAKSGTGKTAVFVITALEMINISKKCVQVMILGPTREIAVQIQQVVKHIGSELKGLGVEYFIGGTPISEDETKILNCQIVVGAPGRIKHLIEKNILDVSEIRLFVLDEADKLMETGFQQTINWIYNKLPKRKQVIAVSATYPDDLDKFLTTYMLSPTHVSPETKMPVLLGIRQFYTVVKFHLNNIQQMKFKTEELTRILSNLSFNQCLVFSNYQTRAESLSNNLNQKGWPSRFISGQQDQTTRLQAVDDLRKFKCRILSSTDLTARGIDAANVDLVINYDVPIDVETYLHRMGRAGRYGSYGICVTIAAEGKDVKNLQKIIKRLGNNVSIAKLPESKFFKDIWQCDLNKLEQLYALDEEINNSENKSSSLSKNVSLDKDISQEKTSHIESKTLDLNSNSNEEIVNRALNQLADLLSKPYNASIHETDIKNINKLLENLKTRMSLESSVALKNISKLDSKSILKELSNGNFPVEKNTSVSKQEPLVEIPVIPENKKTKFEDVKVIPQEKSQVFNKEASNFQQNMLLRKNIALFAISKLIMENKFCDMFIKDCSKEIGNLLEILKEEDDIQLKNYTPEDIKSFLESHNIRYREEMKRVSFVDEISQSKASKISCDCPENIFSTAYDQSITSNGSLNWRNVICSKHNLNETKNESKELKNENATAPPVYEDYYNENNSEMEFEETNSLLKPSSIDENIFSEAYDRAIQGKIEKYQNAETDQESNIEPFGFAAENSYSKKCVNFNHSKRLDTGTNDASVKQIAKEPSYVSPELQSFIERRNVYTSYYQHYSDVLAETAPTFTNVNEFRTWYGKWREEVEAVRDYIQQDIFQKECSKHKY